ncbi:type I restriction endonuclease subunit R [Ligilactobacillus ceti]|uniref:Helicase ATP-binding domain-containing protein n=1 Tax=Ligilactobacillus ceti DSM 22408 TaxID=1122146 RepID=A0A0R2KNX9_9LACO|nr:DEAD/DEAH box helicase family protein [Ligilactobacillus ceti]KRN88684.1 hypothetical protein IV53_GL000649 [Ligilactobacillus ceti DSM 22408]
MRTLISERYDFQQEILDYLEDNQGYIRRTNKDYDMHFALDRELLLKFLYATQSKEMEKLSKIFKEKTEDTIINTINTKITSKGSSLIDVLKNGIEISNTTLRLMYPKPASTLNKELYKKYEQNIFSVMEEVIASNDQHGKPKERVDLVIFLNGLAIICIEIKSNASGQSYEDAILQYREDRNPKTRLFMFKVGALVYFALDFNEVHMSTKLDGKSTYFLPFNKGCGEGVNTGKGNPILPDKYSTSYMWEDVLSKDSLLELISKFIFLEKKEEIDPVRDTKKTKETIIFPRFHQRRCVKKLLDDVYEHKSSRNYLIQHSAGSGKTNSIAWLSHRLATLHDKDNQNIFDNVIVVTDRVVVDRQLQKAVMGLEHKSGFIRVMDDKSTSHDLADALAGKTKIIATTIQKFPHIIHSVKGLKDKRFAVIIDEAHSSTAGKNMAAVSRTLSSTEAKSSDVEDLIADEILRNGKQDNVSIFAFTATPKPTTLQLFAQENQKGLREAFDLYSMKQAIEEGFILDVLQNYTTYKTFYELNKKVEDDPRVNTRQAKAQIARFIRLHETNIAQRIEIIVEHFKTSIMDELGGKAKAMVVTASREEAVKYHKAFNEYIDKKGYKDIKALVAFSGKVTLDDEDIEYTEAGINGFSEKKTAKEFDKDENRVLLVANKYQTGFDQPKLCAMYVLKTLKGVAAVQTLSRLNRICPPFNKTTFILDFVNDYKDIEDAFSKYYSTTLLSNTITPSGIYELEAKIDAYLMFDPDYIDRASEILCKERIDPKDKKKLNYILRRTQKKLDELDEEQRDEFVKLLRKFIRFYEFLIQVTQFLDNELHKKYLLITYLLRYISVKHSGGGFDITSMIKAKNFIQKKNESYEKPKIIAKPVVKLPIAEALSSIGEDKIEHISVLLEEFNARHGVDFDKDVVVKFLLQIQDILLKSEDLKLSAKNNTEQDFNFAYYDKIDDALLDGIEQNRDFCSKLLEDKESKKELLGVFSSSIYKKLREK